ncbi:MAG: radical SAM protein [Oligoflexia bacterium]|nr:radical SAM protein [Oligoflexia bacterium]
MLEVKSNPNSNFFSLVGNVHMDMGLEYLDYRRCWEEYPKNFTVSSFPIHLDIEASSRCNLKCVFCDKLPLLKKDQFGDIDYKLFCKIIHEGQENGLKSIKLSYRGEPLLNREIIKMVDYAKNKGVLDIYFNTNGMLLNKSVSSDLINAGLNRISISIDGTDKNNFEKIRVGANFDTILRNMEDLIELKNQRHSITPKIRIQTVNFLDLDLDMYSKIWGKYADEIAVIDYKDESVREKGLICNNWACPQLWQRMTIEWDGRILQCNNNDTRTLIKYNAWDSSIKEIWNGTEVSDARTMHKKGLSHMVFDCDGCPWRTAQVKKVLSGIDN